MSHVRSIAVLGGAALLVSSTALAHVSISSGPGFADANQVLTFGVGHGCEGADTIAIEIEIPEEVTSVRALVGPAGFGEAELTLDDAELVRAVTWTKADARPGDDQYYQFGLRIKVPYTPFEKLYFPTKQTCRDAEGEEIEVHWALTDEEAAEGGDHAQGSPKLMVMPPRTNGWNKYTVDSKIEDLTIFNDAQIVWSGDAAYSSNAATQALNESDDDVDELTEIKAKAEIWVKY
jgi:uncharacterized protein YcnI